MHRIGSVLDRLPGSKYLASLDFAELAPRPPLPKTATLRKARSGLDEALELSLRAPASSISGERGALRFDDGLERGLAWLLRAVDALSASVVLLPTPLDLTPGQRSRDLLGRYVEKLRASTEATVVWAPSGPWEQDAALEVAERLGLVLAFDPLSEEVPAGPIAYARLKTLGVRRSFSDADLEDVIDRIGEVEQAYIAIESDRSFKQAQRMVAMYGSPLDAT